MATFIKGDKIKPLVVLEEDMVEQEVDGMTALAIPKDKYPNLYEYLYVSFGDMILTRQLGSQDGESGMYTAVYNIPYPQEEGEPSRKTLTYSVSYAIMGVSDDGNYYLCIPSITATFVTDSQDEQFSSIELSRAATYEGYELSEDTKNNFKQNLGIPFVSGDGENSAVLKGGNNKAININEVAIGRYNESNNGTQFSIGIGSANERKNAHEIMQDGKHYILGIGGYDGTNPTESRDLRSVIEPIIIEWDSIKDYANGEGLNNMAELPWLDKTISGEYKKYNWAIQKDGIIHPCVVIPDLNSNHIQMLFFTRNEIEGTTGPLGNAIMKYSGLRMTTGWNDIYGDEYYKAIYKISNGGSLEVREFVFGENTNKNAYLIAAAQMSGIDTIDCKWVYTTKSDETITVNGQYFHIENSITNVDAIFSVKDKSLTYVDGNGLINKVTFADNGSYDISKNIASESEIDDAILGILEDINLVSENDINKLLNSSF